MNKNPLDGMSEEEIENLAKLYKIKKENPECKIFGGWVWYVNEDKAKLFDKKKCGKWMIFSSDIFFLNKLCKETVGKDIVWEAKVAAGPRGKEYVSCFYLHIDDNETHRKLIKYFLDNDAIGKTKSGKYRNIAFKLNEQTRNGEYGDGFIAKLNLDHFIDLNTGEFL